MYQVLLCHFLSLQGTFLHSLNVIKWGKPKSKYKICIKLNFHDFGTCQFFSQHGRKSPVSFFSATYLYNVSGIKLALVHSKLQRVPSTFITQKWLSLQCDKFTKRTSEFALNRQQRRVRVFNILNSLSFYILQRHMITYVTIFHRPQAVDHLIKWIKSGVIFSIK